MYGLAQVVFLNGAEVGRVNLPAAPSAVTATTLASTKILAANYSSMFLFNVSLAKAVPGTNTLAVEVRG
jgi:hypothetical protein